MCWLIVKCFWTNIFSACPGLGFCSHVAHWPRKFVVLQEKQNSGWITHVLHSPPREELCFKGAGLIPNGSWRSGRGQETQAALLFVSLEEGQHVDSSSFCLCNTVFTTSLTLTQRQMGAFPAEWPWEAVESRPCNIDPVVWNLQTSSLLSFPKIVSLCGVI